MAHAAASERPRTPSCLAASRRVVESWRGRIYSGVRDVRLGRGCADATTSERADPALASSAPTRVQRHGRGGVGDPAGERGGARARAVARKVHQTPSSVTSASWSLRPSPGGRPILPPPGKTWGTLPFGFANLTDADFGPPGANPTGSEELIGLRVGALDRPFPRLAPSSIDPTRPFLFAPSYRRARLTRPLPDSHSRHSPPLQLAKPQGSEATTGDVSIVHTGGDHAASTFRAPSPPPPPIRRIRRASVPPRRPPARGVPRRPPSPCATPRTSPRSSARISPARTWFS